MTPGNELRLVRAHKRFAAAGRLLRRSRHLSAAGALCGLTSMAVMVWRDDLAGAWVLIVPAFALNYAAARVSRRARELL